MSARILVVDDNRTNLELMTYMLKAFGHEPEGISDGLRGLELARTGNYDLVLCDVLMPGIDGFEFARRFRAETALRDCKIVAVTALAMSGDRERLLAAGFDGYIMKPIEPQAFLSQVEAFLPERLRANVTHRPSDPAPAAARRQQEGPVILAVDDVQTNLDVIRGALEPFGYRVVSAPGIREAGELLETLRPALVLCDVHMPHGDGFELLTSIKSQSELRDVPFAFLTSTAGKTREKERGLALGASRFLLRPIDPQQLLAEVRAMLGEDARGEDSGR